MLIAKLDGAAGEVRVRLSVSGNCIWNLKYNNGWKILSSANPEVLEIPLGSPSEKNHHADDWTLYLVNPGDADITVEARIEWLQGNVVRAGWTMPQAVDGKLVVKGNQATYDGASIFFSL